MRVLVILLAAVVAVLAYANYSQRQATAGVKETTYVDADYGFQIRAPEFPVAEEGSKVMPVATATALPRVIATHRSGTRPGPRAGISWK